MIGFCGALDFERGMVGFSMLRKMCGLHTSGCAFVNKEFGILCDTVGDFGEESLQPVTVSYNNALYTAAVVADTSGQRVSGSVAGAVLEGYFEEGDGFIRRLDFPYALALYDGRCGELLLAKSHIGDKPLFYCRRDGVLYFASALRPLMRLYGGCVRIDKSVLMSFIEGEHAPMPDGLFCDIRALRRGHSLLCSRLGTSDITTERGMMCTQDQAAVGESLAMPKRPQMRKLLTDALFAFDYPQFDCVMPMLLSRIYAAAKNGETTICINDGIADMDAEYAAERAERLGAAWGIEISSVPSSQNELPASRVLKAMEKEIDAILEEYMSDVTCVLNRLPVEGGLDSVEEEKSIPLRIRKKGMLCQTAMWFESHNLVLV